MAVALSVDVFTLFDQGVLVAAEDLTAVDNAWLKSFYPAFLPIHRSRAKRGVSRFNAQPLSCTGTRPRSKPSDWTLRRRRRIGPRCVTSRVV